MVNSGGAEVQERIEAAFLAMGDATLPSTWFRVAQYLPALEARGIRGTLLTLPRPRGGRLGKFLGLLREAAVRRCQLRGLGRYDVVVVQKGLTSWRCRGLVGRLNRACPSFLYDIDDAIYTARPVVLPGPLARLQDFDEPVKLLRGAAQVMAGNEELARYAGGLNARVATIPTAVDTDRFRPPAERPAGELTIGWSGSASTTRYLNRLLPVLSDLARRVRFRFVVISDTMAGLDAAAARGFPLIFVPWSREAEVASLAMLDIGVMPLPDDEWARGKCGLKALLYMAMEVATVCSPVGVNRFIIRDGENGSLADTDEEWAAKLETLATSGAERRRLGREARAIVERDFSVRAHVGTITGIVAAAAKTRRTR